MQRPLNMMGRGERKFRPKGTPDADAIFGSKKVKKVERSRNSRREDDQWAKREKEIYLKVSTFGGVDWKTFILFMTCPRVLTRFIRWMDEIPMGTWQTSWLWKVEIRCEVWIKIYLQCFCLTEEECMRNRNLTCI